MPSFRLPLCLVVLVVLVLQGRGWCGEDTSEQAKRAEFGKAYGTAKDADGRRAALALLANSTEKASLQMLLSVASSDKDKDVQFEALSALAGCPDQDGTLTTMVVQGFQAQRDPETKAALASVVAKLPMKQPAIQALIAALAPLGFPDVPKSNRNTRADSVAKIEKEREHFGNILGAINTASGQRFEASKTVKTEINAWWGPKQAEFAKADQEYMKGIKAALEEKKKADAEAKKAEAEARKAEADAKKAETKQGGGL